MIQQDHKISLIDFGYGKVITHKHELLIKYCGTPYYMPPEMIKKIVYNRKRFISDNLKLKKLMCGLLESYTIILSQEDSRLIH